MKRSLTNLNKAIWPLYDCERPPDLFCNTATFFRHIELSYERLDVITFTVGNHPLTKVDKLIFAVPATIDGLNACKRARQNTNIHSKLYYCYNSHNLVHVYAGSLNLRLGFNMNIMCKVKDSLRKPLIAYFDELWKTSKKLE